MNREDFDNLRELAELQIITAKRCSTYPTTAEEMFICKQLGKRLLQSIGRNEVIITKCAKSESTRREYDEAYQNARARARAEFK